MRTKKLKLASISGEEHVALARRYPTVEGFLLDQARSHSNASAQGAGSCSKEAVEALSDYIRQAAAPKFVSGLELLETISTKTRLLPTGCASLDQLLKGGLREGQITELAGGSSSGKTQMCLWVALSTALRGERVAYIDATASFSAERLAEMHHHAPQQDKLPLPEALRCISVHRVHDIWEAQVAVAAVEDDLARAAASVAADGEPELPGHGQGEGGKGEEEDAMQSGAGSCSSTGPRVLVLDSLPAIVTPVLGGKQTQGHSLMCSLAASLHRITSRNGVAVLVTNSLVQAQFDQQQQLRGGGASQMKPALGEHWRRQPHCRLMLWVEQGSRVRYAQLSATTLGPVGEEASFEIWEGGIRDPPKQGIHTSREEHQEG